MHLSCNRLKLSNAFSLASQAAPSRSPKPILTNVRLDVEANGTGRLTATDMEIGLVVQLDDLEVKEAGAVLLPSKLLGSLIRESTDDVLTLRTDKVSLKVGGQRSNYKLSCANPDEFPLVQIPPTDKHHRLSAGLLSAMLRRTVFAADVESSRFALGGVLLELSESRAVAVGTDGRRLAKMEGSAVSVNGHTTEIQTIVPVGSVKIIERLLSDADAEVKLVCGSTNVAVFTPNATLITRLVEGRYPRWKDVIPTLQAPLRLQVPTDPLTAAIRQCAITTSDTSRGMDFQFGNGQLRLVAETAEVGESKIELPLEGVTRSVSTSLDYRYVLDFLRNAGESCQLELVDDASATLFSTADGYQYVVMPLAR